MQWRLRWPNSQPRYFLIISDWLIIKPLLFNYLNFRKTIYYRLILTGPDLLSWASQRYITLLPLLRLQVHVTQLCWRADARVRYINLKYYSFLSDVGFFTLTCSSGKLEWANLGIKSNRSRKERILHFRWRILH